MLTLSLILHLLYCKAWVVFLSSVLALSPPKPTSIRHMYKQIWSLSNSDSLRNDIYKNTRDLLETNFNTIPQEILWLHHFSARFTELTDIKENFTHLYSSVPTCKVSLCALKMQRQIRHIWTYFHSFVSSMWLRIELKCWWWDHMTDVSTTSWDMSHKACKQSSQLWHQM